MVHGSPQFLLTAQAVQEGVLFFGPLCLLGPVPHFSTIGQGKEDLHLGFPPQRTHTLSIHDFRSLQSMQEQRGFLGKCHVKLGRAFSHLARVSVSGCWAALG